MNYDIIGDIHGYADALEALLGHLGYSQTGGAWRHPGRQALFVGDFIDRGTKQRESVDLVRGMVDAGTAQASWATTNSTPLPGLLQIPNAPASTCASTAPPNTATATGASTRHS